MNILEQLDQAVCDFGTEHSRSGIDHYNRYNELHLFLKGYIFLFISVDGNTVIIKHGYYPRDVKFVVSNEQELDEFIGAYKRLLTVIDENANELVTQIERDFYSAGGGR